MKSKKQLMLSGGILLAVVLLVMPIMAACAEPAPPVPAVPAPAPSPPVPSPAPAPPAAPPAAPPPGPPPEVIELRFATHIPPMAPVVGWEIAWGEKITELTGGRVTMTMYGAESLVPAPDQYPALLAGICDITNIKPADIPEHELETVYNLPMLGWVESDTLAIRLELEKAFPQLAAGRDTVKTLWNTMHTFAYLHFTEKEVRVPADIEGMKVISPSPDLLKAWGATATWLPPPDWYLALETGLADGMIMPWAPIAIQGLDAVVPIHLGVPIGTVAGGVIMNLDTWNSLPPDIQQIIDGTLSEVQERMFVDDIKVTQGMRGGILAKEGQISIEPTPAESALWAEKVPAVHQMWIEDMEAKGLPGQAVYDKLIEIIGRYK